MLMNLVKKIIAAVIILPFFGCDNTIDLVEKGDTIPIVYALFDPTDNNHYVRLEKAFIDESIPPTQLAIDPTNLYFDQATVQLNKIGSNTKFDFVKIDGDLEGLVREEGAFAQSPNILYKLSNSGLGLNYTDDYTLNISLEDGRQITASTKIVEPAVLIRPNPQGNLDFDDNAITRYNWNPGKNSNLHSMTMLIHFDEIKGSTFNSKVIEWNVFNNITADRFEFAGRSFYQLLASSIIPETGTERQFTGIDVVFTSAGQSVSDYIRVGQANLGITSSGEVPVFTNLSEGRGIVGSRAKVKINNLQLSRNSLDRLKTNDFTKNLNFK